MAQLQWSIDPTLGKQDFSGFIKAGEYAAQGIQNLGKSISGVIDKFAEVKKENSLMTGELKGFEKQIDSAINLFPERKDQLEAMKISINDPTKSLVERYGEAKTYNSFINSELDMLKTRAALNMQDARLNKLTGGGSGGGSGGGGPSSGGGGVSSGGGGAPAQSTGGGWNDKGFSVQ